MNERLKVVVNEVEQAFRGMAHIKTTLRCAGFCLYFLHFTPFSASSTTDNPSRRIMHNVMNIFAQGRLRRIMRLA